MPSLRAMKCYDNMTIDMYESPQSTPSQAPVVLKSVPILTPDTTVMVKQSRTSRLPCCSPSHTLYPLGRPSAAAPPPLPIQRGRDEDKDMKVGKILLDSFYNKVYTDTDKISEHVHM